MRDFRRGHSMSYYISTDQLSILTVIPDTIRFSKFYAEFRQEIQFHSVYSMPNSGKMGEISRTNWMAAFSAAGRVVLISAMTVTMYCTP